MEAYVYPVFLNILHFVLCLLFALIHNLDHVTFAINAINLLNLQLKMPRLPTLQLQTM